MPENEGADDAGSTEVERFIVVLGGALGNVCFATVFAKAAR
jgi:hypothetical protein